MDVDVAKYYDRPIPNLDALQDAAKKYREWPIDETDPRFRDACINVNSGGIAGDTYYKEEGNPPYYRRFEGANHYLFARPEVVKCLQRVNEQLQVLGLQVYVHSAWYSAELYAARRHWYRADLSKKYPTAGRSHIEGMVGKYLLPYPEVHEQVDPLSPPPHTTGAAVGVALKWLPGECLWMGSIFDEVGESAHTDYFERVQPSALTYGDIEARRNRRLLYWVMSEAGFANDPTRWWSYSIGDQRWAAVTSAARGEHVPARYSVADPRKRVSSVK